MGEIKRNNYIYICLIAYIIGLFCTGLFSFSHSFLFLAIIVTLNMIAIGIVLQWRPWGSINYRHCILLALIVMGGFYYYQWRLPTAGSLDISHQLSGSKFASEIVTVEGKIVTTPRINQKQKGKFIFQAQQLVNENSQAEEVTGKVYVTAPLLQVTGLYPSMTIRLTGNLYQPQNSLNPWGFNFADYLSREGIFTGLSANSVDVVNEGNFWHRSLYSLRQRIIQTHVRYLKTPQGSLVSSMVIGSRGVDLDFELQDSFRLAGLAHTLAASGFHVSILLGLLLYLTRSFSSSHRLVTITIILFIYAAIAGFYPSILRACLMGLGVVIGMVYDRSVKVYGSLLLVGVILLLINPVWVWDLGFQLSFLATWGLVVSLPAIVARLDWLSPTLANLVAVPLAATIWTFPLQSYVFHYLPIYGILTNIVTTPLVLIITIGGFISAFIGLFIPLLGSAIAYILLLPIITLIQIVNHSNQLPFSSLAVGEISIFQLLIIYSIFSLICLNKIIRRYWLIVSFATLISVIIPLATQKLNLIQVTLLNNSFTPTIIVQDHNKNFLINLGNKENIRFNIIPFLRSQAINKLDLVLTNNNNQKQFLSNILKQLIKIDNFEISNNKKINYLTEEGGNLELNIDKKKWLIVNHSNNNSLIDKYNPDILIWLDRQVNYEQIKKLAPPIIITSSTIKNKSFLEYLSLNKIQLLSTKYNAIQWQPKTGFKIYDNQ